MAEEIRMPQLGVSMETGIITKWHKNVGDPVKRGDVLVSIETEKLTNDVEAETDGVLLAIIAKEGDELPIRGLMGIVGQPGEKWDAGEAPAAQPAAQPAVATEAPKEDQNAGQPAPAQSGRIKATPLAKKTAEKLGVELSGVQGGGTTGRIKQADVLACAATGKPAVEKREMPSRGVRREKMSGMRKSIMKNMLNSQQINAQTVMRVDVDMTELMAMRKQFAKLERKISYNDIIVRCVARALRDLPVINCSIDGTEIVYHDYVNIGMAVALPNGLIVPVVKDADLKNVDDIHEELTALIDKAHNGMLSEDDYHGGTFTVSSLGIFDVDSFTAIINPPESAILGVCRIHKTPVVTDDDQIVIRPMCGLCLGYDHRVIDGAEAAKFLRLVKRYLEQPVTLL